MSMMKKLTIVALTLIITSSFSIPTFANTAPVMTRLAGADRYATAQAIANQGWTQSDYAILAYGENFPDALSAVPLAKKYNAPILLTSGNNLPDATKKTLIDLKVTNVFIIGGIGVIPASIDTILHSMGITSTRIAGQDRYETDCMVAQQLNVVKNTSVVISYGEDFPDALAISSFAAYNNWPVLLVQADILPDKIKEFLASDQPSKIYITGGTGVVSSKVQAKIQEVVPSAQVTRFAGQDRFDTATLIVQNFAPSPQNIYFASGYGFADALAGSVIAAKTGDPIVLVDPESYTLPPKTLTYLSKIDNSKKTMQVISFGGTAVVPESQMIHANSILSNAKVNPVPPSGVSLNKSNTVINVGANENLTATVTPTDATNNVTWKSSNVEIATVDSNGKVVGVSAGTAAITVTTQDGSQSDICIVTVSDSSLLKIYTPSEIAKMVSPSVVYIEVSDSSGIPTASGSGFIIDSTGKIATNFHVINGAYSAKVKTYDGKIYDVTKVLSYDSVQDMALIKINATGLIPVTLGNSDNIGTGDKIYTIGNPLGLDHTMSDGLISTKSRVVDGATYIQISAPISPGSSGGVLVNEQAETIGITAAGMTSGQNLNFAIPINLLKPMLSQDINKTLAQLAGGSVGNMTDEQFQTYLNTNYGSLTIDGLTIHFNWEINKITLTGTDEFVGATLDSGQYLNWLEWCTNSRYTSIQSFLAGVNSKIHANYPNKRFYGGISYQDYWNTYPSSFPTSEVSYNYTMHQWLVTHICATIYCLDGNLTGVDVRAS